MAPRRDAPAFRTGIPTTRCGSARGSNSAGGAYEVARLKRDKNSLVDANDRPLDESLLTAELAGVDREAFHMMFSLDDESLEKGGEAILASRGDLGQLLFSASAGLAEISDRLESLRKKADEFYRPRASTTELAELKRELDALKHERDEADTLAPAYAELVRQRDAAREAYAAAAKSSQRAARARRRDPASARRPASSRGAARGGERLRAARSLADAAGRVARRGSAA